MCAKRTDENPNGFLPMRYRVDADRQSASRRVRYVETSHPASGDCRLCQLDRDFAAPAPTGDPMHDTHDDDEAISEQALLQAVENQLEAGEPAFVQAVLNKLTLVGIDREEALHAMALVLANEIRTMLAEDRPFDTARYEALLRNLPELPDEDDDAQ